MSFESTLDWLLEPSNASARWLALTRLLGRPESDPEVRAARAAIPTSPWAVTIMSGQHPDGWWEDRKNLGHPKLTGTAFRLEALADIGMPLTPEVRRACDLVLENAVITGEGFAPARYARRAPHECGNGRLLFVFNAFGLGDDPRVRAAAEWLLANQMLDGGWNCNHEPKIRRDPTGGFSTTHECALDLPHHKSSLFTTMAVIKGLASMPSPPRDAIAPAVEFLLQHRIHWAKNSRRAIYGWPVPLLFPPQLRYDGLQPLQALALAGAEADDRAKAALDYLELRAQDGRWPTDGPPIPPSKRADRTLLIEPKGTLSKWVTVQALYVLRHFGRLSI